METNLIDKKLDLLDVCLEALQEFVDRVDRGEVRSSYTYDKFKSILQESKHGV